MSDTHSLVLGLEIHLHVKTAKKMFCYCDANIYGEPPNTHTCPVCLGLPGSLPVANFEAVKKTQLLGMALNCKLNRHSNFDRKHYFYPDLPKGYQISQYKSPLCGEGYLDLDNGTRIEIERIHLEEDTAKSFHEGNKSYIDFSKSGMPLIEIVTKPVFRSVEDAVEFCKKVQDIVRVLDISGADMEKGQFRLEANISVRTKEQEISGELPKYKVEVKNINSFRFMEKAVRYEHRRQLDLLNQGETPVQENRGWDEKSQKTLSQREKEEAHDYRYFPEPDLPPMSFDESHFTDISLSLVELPYQKKQRYTDTLGINSSSASWLTNGDGLLFCELFEKTVALGADPQKTANTIINKKESRTLEAGQLLKLLNTSTEAGLAENEIEPILQAVISENPKAVADYRLGKESAIQFLLGMVMRKHGAIAPAEKLAQEIKRLLG